MNHALFATLLWIPSAGDPPIEVLQCVSPKCCDARTDTDQWAAYVGVSVVLSAPGGALQCAADAMDSKLVGGRRKLHQPNHTERNCLCHIRLQHVYDREQRDLQLWHSY